MPASQPQTGVTLIELMITLAIIAILASAIIPSYRSYMTESEQERVKIELLSLTLLQERYYLENNAYAISWSELGITSNPNLQLQLKGETLYTVTIGKCSGYTDDSTTTTSSCYQFTAAVATAGYFENNNSLILDSRNKMEPADLWGVTSVN